MTNLLEIRGLTKSYESFALRILHLEIKRGTITGLVGSNGAGKSTLIKAVLGLVKPDVGMIRLFGQDIREDATALRARIGFVQENPTLFPYMKVPDLGRTVASFYPSWNRTTFNRLCERFELPLRKPFRTFSQGTRMKTALALALSHDAELLLLDEPTSGLDPLARRDVLDLLQEVIQDEHKAVLFSTHITTDLDRVADHVAVLRDGRITLSGSKDKLLERWTLVKGSEELCNPLIMKKCRGGQRTELGLTLLCEEAQSWTSSLPSGCLLERPTLEDLLYFHGRELEEPCLP